MRGLNAERHARGLSCSLQFVSMSFCELGRVHSLREIVSGLRSCESKLSHLSGHRPWQLYQSVFHLLYARCQT